MKVPSFGRIGRRVLSLVQQRNVASGVAVALVSTMVVVAAVQADGSKATNVQLDDGAVWVSNQSFRGGYIGRLNIRINELDLALQAGPDADVLQHGRDVTFTGPQGGLRKVDVVGGLTSGENTVDFANYQMNGGIATLFDPESGRLWVGSSATIVGADYPEKADAQLEPGSRVVVTAGDKSGSNGKVLVVDSTGWFELELDEGFKPVREASGDASSTTISPATSSTEPPAADDSPLTEDVPEPIKVPKVTELETPIDDATAVTAVGDRLVFLGDDGSLFSTGGKTAQIPGDNAVLQQAGPEHDSVLVASSTGLFEVSIGSDQVTRLAEAAAAPAQPVRVDECVYGAWSGLEPTWFEACRGEVLTPVTAIQGAVSNAHLVYRVNQRNVAINSIGDGGVWADHDGKLAQVGNWEDAQAKQHELDDALVGQATRESEKQCIEGDNGPKAGDDELGSRPRQSIIDVLYNDDDPNCEPLAIVAESVLPASEWWGQLTVIDNGQHLLLSPSQELKDSAATSPQRVTFTYQVEDSARNLSNAAQVTLTVYDVALGNVPPELRPIKNNGTTRQMRTVVEEGQSVSYDVTTDWWDPDGDDLVLRGAVPERGEVTSSPDGVVRYSAYGVTAGPQDVMVTMSDGKAEKTEPLEVTVKPAGSPIPPITAHDFITLVEGVTGTVFPLANDSDPNEDPLALVPDWPTDSPDFRVKTVQDTAIEITGAAAGTYALKYLASDGVDETRGTVRLVVLAPDGTNHSPIAVPDKVRMRSDRVVNVDVLANDVDADGDVLAITDVKVADGSGGIIRAAIIDRRMIQLEVVPGPDGAPPVGPFNVDYTLTDGHAAERAASQDDGAKAGDLQRSQGSIAVSIVPAIIDQPPVTAADVVEVRSGDVASVPVLANDIDPDGDPVALSAVFQDQASQLEASGSVVSWVAGRNVFLKGGTPGTYTLQYTVLANGKPATGKITIHVTALPDSVTPNNPPAPKALVLRAVRNTTVRLQVPTFGVDRDGDSVTVLDSFGGLAGAAAGSRVEVDPQNPTVILFTAGQSAGTTDEFTYSLRDTYNGVGTATVTVLVLDNQGWPPQAHDDVLRAKPGRTLRVPVLANDTSPQDAPLQLAENPFLDKDGLPTAVPLQPKAVAILDQSVPSQRGIIEVKVPQDGSVLSQGYQITDGTNSSRAYVRITPDPNAPNLPPVANTDVVKAAEVAGRESVTVDVLRNDLDPDDDRPLAVTLPVGESASVVDGKVTVKVTASPQIVLYRIEDGDGASTVGLIRVPGVENHPPVLTAIGKDPTARTVEASATAPITILLADIVEDPDNDPEVQLTDTEVKVAGGQGTVSRLPGGDGFTYSPPSSAAQALQVTIQFEVTDRPGVSADERQQPACNCLASLPVVVNVTAASPPTVLSQGNVQVPQLEEPVVYDLAPLVRDDQNDPLIFSIEGASVGLTITQSGSQITIVSNEEGLAVGQRIRVGFTVTDGTSEPVQGTVWVTVIATNKGQPAAASFPEQNAQRDETLSLPNVIGPATNPFPTRPLTLLNPTVDGGAQVSCSPTGDCQFMSPNVGTFRVTYALKDALNQTAVGTIVVVVKGKPRAPGVPRIESVGDHVVNLTWTAADMQGGTLKAYHVTAVESGETMQFTTTGGQFTGLTNGSTYHFTVVAENELGMGEPSVASSPAIPDRVPDPPVSPTFTDYGDGTLYLAWAPPPTANEFSPIQSYEVSIGGKTFTTDGSTSVVASGLQNGTDYTFTVRAQNAATTNNGWGESSASSAPERPSRHPDAPSAPRAVNSGDGGSPRLTVTWGPPTFDGGRPITAYEVCGGGSCQTVAGGLQATFNAARNESLSFTVVASNTDIHDPDSPPSLPSDATTAIGLPDAPVIAVPVVSGDRTLTATASSANNSGCSSVSIEYQINGGAWQSSGAFAGLTNGTSYSIVASAVLPPSCGTAGATYRSLSTPVSQTPYGPLVQPSMNVSRSGNVITWTWADNRNGDGRPGWAATLSGECAGQGSPYSHDFGYSSGTRTCTITVSAPGLVSLSASASSSTPNQSRTISTSNSGISYNPAGCNGTCTRVAINGQNFTPNAPLQVLCEGYPVWFNLGTAGPDGSFSIVSGCAHSPAVTQVVSVRDGTGQASDTSFW